MRHPVDVPRDFVGSGDLLGQSLPGDLAKKMEESPWTRFHGPATSGPGYGLSIVLGGTSIRAILANDQFEYDLLFQDKWEALGKEVDGKTIFPTAEEYLDIFVAKVSQELASRGIRFNDLVVTQASVAAPLSDGEDGQKLITTQNSPVKFLNFPFEKEILTRFRETAQRQGQAYTVESIQVENDGRKGYLGEIEHPLGQLKDVGKGIYIILGTGIGGFGEDISEIGHCLLYNTRTKEYEYHDVKWLERHGLYKNGSFVLPENGMSHYTYFEHRLAGPWIAIRFLKTIDNLEDEGATMMALAKFCGLLSDSPEDNRAVLSALTGLTEMRAAERHRWGQEVRDKLIRPVLEFIFNANEETFACSQYFDSELSPEEKDLQKRAFEFKAKVFSEIGHALAAIRKEEKFAEKIIVLGSGVAQACGQSQSFDNVVAKKSRSTPGTIRVSKITCGEIRESASVTKALRELAKAA